MKYFKFNLDSGLILNTSHIVSVQKVDEEQLAIAMEDGAEDWELDYETESERNQDYTELVQFLTGKGLS